MSDAKAQVRSDIMSFLRDARTETGQPFVELFFSRKYLMNYNPKEKEAVSVVLSELVKEGFFNQQDGKYILSAAGFEVLNPGSPKEAIERVKNDIMSWFRGANSAAGHALNMKSFMFGTAMGYTSKEKDALPAAMRELTVEGLVEERNENVFLTQKGVDTIY